MKEKNAAVAVYKTHEDAEAAVRELQHWGFDMQKLSIVGKGFYTEDHVLGFFNLEDRVKVWSKRGAFWGGLGGLLVGSGFILIPGVGPLVVLGPVVSTLVNTAAGAALGSSLSAFGAALNALGIPQESALRFERAVKAEQYLLLLEGSPAEIEEAASLLETSAELAEIYQLTTGGMDM